MRPLLLKKVQAQGYKIFTNGKYNLNIIGVRHRGRPNEFDDIIALVYRDETGGWVTREFTCTMDPGTYWLDNPMNVEGTAVICPGQYKSYSIDKHRGQYDALCQRIGPIKVWRSPEGEEIQWDNFDDEVEGWYGVNLHHAGTNSTRVDKWSAGCQVFARLADWSEAVRIWKASGAELFTYTLITEDDIS